MNASIISQQSRTHFETSSAVSSLKTEATTVRDGSIRVRLEKVPGKVGAGAVLFREDEQCRALFLNGPRKSVS